MSWRYDKISDLIKAWNHRYFSLGWQKIDYEKEELSLHLRDHYFYLMAIKGYGTPVKVKYHDDPTPSIEVLLGRKSETIYSFDWPGRIKYWMPLPEFPEDFDWRLDENGDD